MKFDLKKPCDNCPFRNDKFFYLSLARKVQIAKSLERGENFSCHKTINYDEWDYEPDRQTCGEDEQFCAGALIICLKGDYLPQLPRIAERLGVLKVDELDMDAPVYDSFDEWIDAPPKGQNREEE